MKNIDVQLSPVELLVLSDLREPQVLAAISGVVQLYAELPDEHSLLLLTRAILDRLVDRGLIGFFWARAGEGYDFDLASATNLSHEELLDELSSMRDPVEEGHAFKVPWAVLSDSGRQFLDSVPHDQIPFVSGHVSRPWAPDWPFGSG